MQAQIRSACVSAADRGRPLVNFPGAVKYPAPSVSLARALEDPIARTTLAGSLLFDQTCFTQAFTPANGRWTSRQVPFVPSRSSASSRAGFGKCSAGCAATTWCCTSSRSDCRSAASGVAFTPRAGRSTSSPPFETVPRTEAVRRLVGRPFVRHDEPLARVTRPVRRRLQRTA